MPAPIMAASTGVKVQSGKQLLCCEGLAFYAELFRKSVWKAPREWDARRESNLESQIQDISEKLDVLTRQFTAERQVTNQSQDGRSASEVLEETEKLGIEVAKFSNLPQFDASILDTYIPRYRRLTQLHFGHIVSNPHAPMAFKEKMGYNMTYNMVPPGNGNALHMHQSIEIFVALDGKWEIAWGMKGENTVVLQPWDFVAVPARVCHSYKNIESDTAQNIMTILPGKSWITWAPQVVDEARQNGAECLDNGMLLKYAKQTSVGGEEAKGLGAQADSVQWKSMGPDDMLPFLHRFSEQRPFECIMHEEAGPDGKAPFIEMFWKTIQPESDFILPRKDGADLLLVVLEGSVLVKTGLGRTIASAGKLDAVRIPVQAFAMSQLSDGAGVIISNQCLSTCTLLVTATQMRSQNELYFHLC